MNVWIAAPSVISMPSVPILLAVTLACVNLDTLEMGTYVLVSGLDNNDLRCSISGLYYVHKQFVPFHGITSQLWYNCQSQRSYTMAGGYCCVYIVQTTGSA